MLGLPIDAHLDEIRAAVAAGNLVIVAEPGAGKTTRVPPALLDVAAGSVVVLEPRRLATRMAAARVAEERGTRLGDEVGYAVRFERKASERTRLLFVTEGVMIKRLAREPLLPGVGVVVLDELHERSLNTDLALALLRRAQRARPELRLVAMSATLDAAPIAAFLDAPTVQVSGRTFPVEVTHQQGADDRELERRVASAVRAALEQESQGDVLVFLPGASEIRRSQEKCEPVAKRLGARLALLHGDLPFDVQDKAVRPSVDRRVVLSTNIAESSVTLPNVVTVIDSGLARQPRHSAFSGLSVLETVRISQASAIQRAGRAGRVRAGRCIRLYGRGDFDRRAAYDPPQILRSDLTELVLLLAELGLGPNEVQFYEAPPAPAIEAAHGLLSRMGALRDGKITDIGKRILGLPLHPRLGRVLVEAEVRGAASRGCLLAAVLAERDVRRSSRSIDGPTSQAHHITGSDVLARLEDIEAAEAEGLRNRELLGRDLDPATFRAIGRTSSQLRRRTKAPAQPNRSLDEEEEDLIFAILAGFPDRVGQRQAESARVAFVDAGGGELDARSSVREGRFLVATEAVEARGKGLRILQATRVEPDQILELFIDSLVEAEELRFDTVTEQVIRSSSLRYGRLVLEESNEPASSDEDTAIVLAQAVRDVGLSRFFDLDALEQLKRRISLGAAHGLRLRAVDEALIDEALVQLCYGGRSFSDVKSSSLVAAIDALQDPGAMAHLRTLAPEHISIPGRAKVPVQYEAERDPWIQSRLQDFFGMAEGPSIAGGKVPLVLHLQAPNRRAVQVTTDLAGFWERHYPTIRKELMRRYPRHAWPEDPLSAKPRKPGRSKEPR